MYIYPDEALMYKDFIPCMHFSVVRVLVDSEGLDKKGFDVPPVAAVNFRMVLSSLLCHSWDTTWQFTSTLALVVFHIQT